MEFSKHFKSPHFSIVQSSLNPNITFLGEKLWQVAWNQKFTSVYIRKKSKNAYKKRKNENLKKKNKKNRFFFSCHAMFASDDVTDI